MKETNFQGKNSLLKQLAKIKFMVLDFDGVFTDNSVIQFADGKEAVVRSRFDALGFDLLDDAGLLVRNSNNKEFNILILSREANPIVKSTAQKLGLRCIQSQYEKTQTLKSEMEIHGFKKDQTLYMGNDLNDLPCFKIVGLSITPNNADERVKTRADYVTKLPGGGGAIREICELLLRAKGLHPLA